MMCKLCTSVANIMRIAYHARAMIACESNDDKECAIRSKPTQIDAIVAMMLPKSAQVSVNTRTSASNAYCKAFGAVYEGDWTPHQGLHAYRLCVPRGPSVLQMRARARL